MHTCLSLWYPERNARARLIRYLFCALCYQLSSQFRLLGLLKVPTIGVWGTASVSGMNQYEPEGGGMHMYLRVTPAAIVNPYMREKWGSNICACILG